jgi:hypothetical protein
MGANFDQFSVKQQSRRARLTAIVLATTIVFSMGLLGLTFLESKAKKDYQAQLIRCMEEQLSVKILLQQAEERVKMEQFRSEHLQAQIEEIKVAARHVKEN